MGNYKDACEQIISGMRMGALDYQPCRVMFGAVIAGDLIEVFLIYEEDGVRGKFVQKSLGQVNRPDRTTSIIKLCKIIARCCVVIKGWDVKGVPKIKVPHVRFEPGSGENRPRSIIKYTRDDKNGDRVIKTNKAAVVKSIGSVRGLYALAGKDGVDTLVRGSAKEREGKVVEDMELLFPLDTHNEKYLLSSKAHKEALVHDVGEAVGAMQGDGVDLAHCDIRLPNIFVRIPGGVDAVGVDWTFDWRGWKTKSASERPVYVLGDYEFARGGGDAVSKADGLAGFGDCDEMCARDWDGESLRALKETLGV